MAEATTGKRNPVTLVARLSSIVAAGTCNSLQQHALFLHLTGMTLQGVTAEQLAESRAKTDNVLAFVEPGSLYERPIPLRHRLIFYLGHLEAFDWNLVVEHGIPLTRFDVGLDRLFAFGIDPDSTRAPADQPSDWPDLRRVHEYCDQVRHAIDNIWSALPAQLQHICLEHRLMHAETLAYMLHNMDHDRLVGPGVPDPPLECAVQQDLVKIPTGVATLGRRPDEGFGWDNEYHELPITVKSFSINRYKVSNREYLAFVTDGGPAPHYWRRENGTWFLRRMFDFVPLPSDWPVWVTREQAAAYANWAGASLPTEAQWHRAAYGTHEGEERLSPWQHSAAIPGAHGNFGALQWDPSSPAAHPLSESAFGVRDLVGNGWEWTSTPFAPFPGFRPFSSYPGYSADFFDGEHFVLKGASPRTDNVFLRRSFRNWFRSDYPYVFAGFRCVYNHD